jgi:hypothetical protein
MFSDVEEDMRPSQGEETTGTVVMEPPAVESYPAPAAVASRPAFVARLLPSLTDVVVVVSVVGMFGILNGARSLLGDGDTGWHIRTGQWILQNGTVPHQDIFSYTKAGQPWFAWEWLWDVAFGWMHQTWGLAGVVLASAALIAATFVLVYRLALRMSGNPVLAVAVSVAGMFGASIHWLARPHLVTWLFLIGFCWLIERAREGQKRALLWLPALTVLWANLHGGFVAGLILIGAYAAGELVAWAVETRPAAKAAARIRLGWFAGAGVACAAASLINPYGYQLHVHIARYLGDASIFADIGEFLSYNFQHPAAKLVEAMLMLGAIAAAWSVYRRRFGHAIVLVVWAHAGLFSARHIPLFLIVAAPIVALSLAELVGLAREADVAAWLRRAVRGFERLAAEIGSIERIGRVPVVSAAALIALAVLMRADASDRFRAEFDARRFPVAAVAAIPPAELASGVFTSDQWADYLIYRLYPEIKVFIDGRSDFYGPRLGAAYIQAKRGKWDWQQVLDRYHVRTVLLPIDAPLVSALKESPRWRVRYDDHVAIFFERVSATPPDGMQAPAVENGGLTAVARPHTPKPVVPTEPQSYARRK